MDLNKKIFKKSRNYYRQGRLEEAEIGFSEIQASGMELGFFDRGGDFTSVEGYLEKIKNRKALAEAQAVESSEVPEPVEIASEAESIETEAEEAPVPYELEAVEVPEVTEPVEEAEPVVEEPVEEEDMEAAAPSAAPAAEEVTPSKAEPARPAKKEKKSFLGLFGSSKQEKSAALKAKINELLANGPELPGGNIGNTLAAEFIAEVKAADFDGELGIYRGYISALGDSAV